MVCGYYGLDIDLFNFWQCFGSFLQGVILMFLSKIVEYVGLKSCVLLLDLDEICQFKLFCVFYWGMNYYVVLIKVCKFSFIVYDLVLGKCIIGIQEMFNYFIGVVLEFWFDQNFQQEKVKFCFCLLDLMCNIVGLKLVLLKIFVFFVVVEVIGLLFLIGI